MNKTRAKESDKKTGREVVGRTLQEVEIRSWVEGKNRGYWD